MLKIVFMGTPEFSVPTLETLSKFHSIVGVYTQPDKPTGRGLELRASPVKRKALELGFPVFQPEKLSLPGEYERLVALQPDIIVVVAYGQILRKNVLDLPRLGCINIHSSLLPRWRGAAPIQWAILAGDSESGITTMYMAEKLDAGDILLQAKTPISSNDTAKTLHDRLSLIGAELIVSTLQQLSAGTLNGQPQNEPEITYAAKLTKEMEWLDPQHPAGELDRRVRALDPWPGTSVKLYGQRLKIKKTRCHPDLPGKPGQVFEKVGMILLGTTEGSLELISMQWEGKKETDPRGFMNGLKNQNKSLPTMIDGTAP